MAEIKTKVTDDSVEDFINAVENERRKKDGFALLEMMTNITGEKARLWRNTTSGFIGFGQYHYKSDRSNQEGFWPLTGFSPRKANLVIYLMHGFEKHADLLDKLGKHKSSMGCLYINKLDDVDLDVLKELIKQSYLDTKKANSA